MQKINGISFQGIENKKPKTIKQTTTTNPVTVDLGREYLPVCDRSLAVNPTLPSTYINQSDLKRYKKVQQKWAETIAKDLEISTENILARLPKVKIGDAKIMTTKKVAAHFLPHKNIAEVNPIRELTSLGGGDEVKIVHESTHGFLHNLRRAYAKQIPFEQLCQELSTIIINRMYHGEHGEIFQNSNEEMMNAPSLCEKERLACIKTLNALQMNHIETCLENNGTYKLNTEGINFLKQNLLPQLDEYSKTLVGTPEEIKEKTCAKITDYINSFFARRDILIKYLTSPDFVNLPENIKTPLSQVELNIAKNTLDGMLPTYEGNASLRDDTAEFSDQASKSYFKSFEERLARKFENQYRLNEIEQKIKLITAKGLATSANLLKEKQIINNNLNLLKLMKELDLVEGQIVSAPKDPKKLLEISKKKKLAKDIVENPKIKKITELIEWEAIGNAALSGKTDEELITLITANLTPAQLKLYDYLNKKQGKVMALIGEINKLNTPENLLAKTKENQTIKSQFDTILTKIKTLANNCDLLGMPRSFYENDGAYLKTNEEAIRVFTKWIRKNAQHLI